MILISPRAGLALCDAVFAARLWNGDLSLERLEDDRRFCAERSSVRTSRVRGLAGGVGFLLGHLHFASEVSSSEGVSAI